MTKYVYDFTEGDKDQKDLLGGKGANLAEMTKLGSAGAARVHHHHRGVPRVPAPGHRAGRAAGPGDDGAAAAGGRDSAGGWATGTTRCWSASGPARSSRCPA